MHWGASSVSEPEAKSHHEEKTVSDVNELVSRIEGAFAAVKEKMQRAQEQELQLYQERQLLLKEYEKAQARIVEAVKPRLEALAKRAGNRATVTPSVSGTRRSARFEFKSSKVHIDLTFAVAPDRELKNVVVEQDVRIVPVLWSFESHAEIATPVASPDIDAVTRWLDDRIVGFVELFIQIHESEIYDKAEYVEDPVAHVRFPRFAAGATLEHGGQTYFFIDEKSKGEFARQKGLTTA